MLKLTKRTESESLYPDLMKGTTQSNTFIAEPSTLNNSTFY
jgi:hypothetical protein